MPEGLEGWLAIYMSLQSPENLTYSEVKSYCDVTGIRLTALQVKALFMMDRAAKEELNAVMKESVKE